MAYNDLAKDYNPSYRIGFYGVNEDLKEKIEMALGKSFFTFYNEDGLTSDDLLDTPDLIIDGEDFMSKRLEEILNTSQAALISVSTKDKEELANSGSFSVTDDEEFKIMIDTTIKTAMFSNALKIKDIIDQGIISNDKVSSLMLLMEKKDPYTFQHSQDVAEYSELIAKEMGFDVAEVERIKLGGLLHDIGKICLTDSILFNQTPQLSEDKLAIMQTHPSLGVILLPEELDEVEDMIKLHHERLDGSGYPYGLRADDLADDVRIISVADTYDAMTSERSYQAAMSDDEALNVLDRLSSGDNPQLDSRVVQALKQVLVKEKENLKVNEGRSR